MKGYPDLTNIPQNCHVSGDGSVMSGGDAPPPGGRGYPHHLPPTVAPPPGGGPPQRSVRHQQQPPPWPAHNPVGGIVGGFYGDPHLGGVRGGQWQAKPGNPLFGLAASLVGQEAATSPQSEGIDLSAPRGGGGGGGGDPAAPPPLLRNGEKSPVNGQVVKEAAVSVIAPNPLREEIDINVSYGHPSTVTAPQPPPAPMQQFLGVRGASEGLPPAAPAPKEEPPVETALVPPTSLDIVPLIKDPVVEVKEEANDVPSQDIAAVPEDSAKEVKTEEVPPEVASLGTMEAAPSTPSKGAVDVDRVESLLENMFQSGVEESPIPQSVIVSNCARQPALTEDKVVAILEDKVDEVKTPIPEDSEDNKMEVVLEDEKEDGGEKFTRVESELEKMFAGIVEPTDDSKGSTETKPAYQQPTGDVVPRKGKKKSSTTKPKVGRKLSDGGKRSKKRGGSFSSGDRKAKRPKLTNSLGPKITKEGSNDSSMTGGGSNNQQPVAGSNSTGRLRGPYVHIEGNRDNPSYVSVVNGGSREEEERERGGVDKSSSSVRRKTQAQHHTEGRLKGPGLYSSTLSARYNSNNIDTTWVCVFCKQRPHCERGLGGEPAGDLFGPYMLNIVAGGGGDLVPAGTPTDREVSEEQKKKGGGRQLSLRAAGVAQQFANSFAKKSKQQQRHSGDSSADSCGGGVQEVWVHEQCAVWAPGVVIVGTHLIGLEEAVSAASATKCSHCGVKGAGLGCVVRGCPTRCHYGCALATNWHLDQDTFISKCPNHTLPAAPQGYVSLAMLKSTA